MKEQQQFFGICPSCARLEFYELNEDGYDNQLSGKVNYLKSDGSMLMPNSYTRLKRKDYLDYICSFCECVMVIIPFDVCDLEQRKKVYKMNDEERKKFAERFELLDSLEENGEEEYYA